MIKANGKGPFFTSNGVRVCNASGAWRSWNSRCLFLVDGMGKITFSQETNSRKISIHMQMERMIPGGNYDELRRLKDTLRIARFNTLCQYCKELFHASKDNENLKVALDFIQKTKQYLSREDVDGISKNIKLNTIRYINLGMDDATQEVLNN